MATRDTERNVGIVWRREDWWEVCGKETDRGRHQLKGEVHQDVVGSGGERVEGRQQRVVDGVTGVGSASVVTDGEIGPAVRGKYAWY